MKRRGRAQPGQGNNKWRGRAQPGQGKNMMRGKSPKQYPSTPDLGGLERALGHNFNNPDLLTQALTHSSATPERLQSN